MKNIFFAVALLISLSAPSAATAARSNHAIGTYMLVHGIWSLTNPRDAAPPVRLGFAPYGDAQGISGLTLP